MQIRNRRSSSDRPALQMTAMIDIVFLLLVFFVMTFKVVVPEGDFNLKLPLIQPGAAPTTSTDLPPIRVQLRADGDGTLTGIQMNAIALGTDFNSLRNRVMSIIGPERGSGTLAELAEVEIDCDYGLRYEYVIAAMTAISGYRADDGSVVQLIEKIKLTSPQKPG